MDDHEKEFEVTLMCEVFEVSRSGYYSWKTRPASSRQSSQQELLEAIREIHREVKEVYGSPRMHRELRERGYEVSENTVAKLMNEAGCLFYERCCVRSGENSEEVPGDHRLEA